MSDDAVGKAVGGKARAKSLSPARRKEISANAVKAKAELKGLPRATHGSADHPLKIGDVEIQCYVLDNGTRVLSQRGVLDGLKMGRGTGGGGGDRLASFAGGKGISPFLNNDLLAAIENPIKFIGPRGGSIAYGYPAAMIADICDAILSARKAGALQKQQEHIAHQAEILVRGFARVGIIALVDEATGYQKDRAKDALAQILEAFVAKELQPYIRTFPVEYYEQLFRIYSLPYPPVGNKSWRPSFFGKITNEVVYTRLAPELLPELKKAASKAEKKSRLHQWLTQELGHPKLKEHLASLVAILKLSKTPQDFMRNVNQVHPRYGTTAQLPLDDPDQG